MTFVLVAAFCGFQYCCQYYWISVPSSETLMFERKEKKDDGGASFSWRWQSSRAHYIVRVIKWCCRTLSPNLLRTSSAHLAHQPNLSAGVQFHLFEFVASARWLLVAGYCGNGLQFDSTPLRSQQIQRSAQSTTVELRETVFWSCVVVWGCWYVGTNSGALPMDCGTYSSTSLVTFDWALCGRCSGVARRYSCANRRSNSGVLVLPIGGELRSSRYFCRVMRVRLLRSLQK